MFTFPLKWFVDNEKEDRYC